MTAIILSIGDELVLGQTIDTNSAWLSRQLAAAGCEVAAHMTVPDDQAAIEEAIRNSAPHCDYLIITGGLGPTADDLTRQALAAVMNEPLELNETCLTKLKEFFRARGREMPEINRIQAMIPRGARMIENTCGTAAGLRATLHIPSSLRRSVAPSPCEVFVMPGVPKEMFAMFDRAVLPVIRQSASGAVILSKTLHTFGLGESAIAERLGSLMDRRRNPSVGTTVSAGVVSLRINARYADAAEAQRELEKTESACRAALGDLIFGADDETLPQVVARMLASSRKTVATAESCTGGLLAKYLTDIPGSSNYFRFGWITYANQAKTDLLGVNPELLSQHGAVSEPVVAAMAAGALEKSHADCALAISGIAGPDGGTATKPVGTICIALATSPSCLRASVPSCLARTFSLFGDREMIRDRAAKMALTMLRYHLIGKEMPF